VRRERVLKSGDDPVVMVRPFTMVPNVIELSYYSSALLSQFVLDSVVGECNCGAVYARCGKTIMRLQTVKICSICIVKQQVTGDTSKCDLDWSCMLLPDDVTLFYVDMVCALHSLHCYKPKNWKNTAS
jgi:hypothetical protein